ncbi:hypothetical protein CAPTEDRAFT_187852 [Capitella teleta]|uniref:Uncharacterized protein n=1 Tax=Capitella teleta TaxID=283909 RepID=R7TUY0_CAPTE|nr:hypothetical protein CAPTEDRAFT_187852 [Capitella teleta]|eukprot:ELT97718.1 hypothetical protein CAPTEDRAFT_187852 [Capitella teleta]
MVVCGCIFNKKPNFQCEDTSQRSTVRSQESTARAAIDNGVVRGSGLGPRHVVCVYFAPIFDAARHKALGFADDLNLLATDQRDLEDARNNGEDEFAKRKVQDLQRYMKDRGVSPTG